MAGIMKIILLCESPSVILKYIQLSSKLNENFMSLAAVGRHPYIIPMNLDSMTKPGLAIPQRVRF